MTVPTGGKKTQVTIKLARVLFFPTRSATRIPRVAESQVNPRILRHIRRAFDRCISHR